MLAVTAGHKLRPDAYYYSGVGKYNDVIVAKISGLGERRSSISLNVTEGKVVATGDPSLPGHVNCGNARHASTVQVVPV